VPERLAVRFGGAYRLLYNKYYVDQIYDAMFVNRTKDLATALGAFDRGVINGLGVDGAAWLTRAFCQVSMVWDSWIVDGIVNLVARIAWVLSIPVRMLQSGRVGNYALLIVLGAVAGLAYYLHASGITLHNALH
jgi:NADH-quinone oxidoreductase subunit L